MSMRRIEFIRTSSRFQTKSSCSRWDLRDGWRAERSGTAPAIIGAILATYLPSDSPIMAHIASSSLLSPGSSPQRSAATPLHRRIVVMSLTSWSCQNRYFACADPSYHDKKIFDRCSELAAPGLRSRRRGPELVRPSDDQVKREERVFACVFCPGMRRSDKNLRLMLRTCCSGSIS